MKTKTDTLTANQATMDDQALPSKPSQLHIPTLSKGSSLRNSIFEDLSKDRYTTTGVRKYGPNDRTKISGNDGDTTLGTNYSFIEGLLRFFVAATDVDAEGKARGHLAVLPSLTEYYSNKPSTDESTGD